MDNGWRRIFNRFRKIWVNIKGKFNKFKINNLKIEKGTKIKT